MLFVPNRKLYLKPHFVLTPVKVLCLLLVWKTSNYLSPSIGFNPRHSFFVKDCYSVAPVLFKITRRCHREQVETDPDESSSRSQEKVSRDSLKGRGSGLWLCLV